MNIEIEYDSSASSAPAGFKTAVQAAVDYLDSLITNPITVPIVFSWGEIQGQALSTIGQSSSNGWFLTYAQLKAALTSSATSADDFASLKALPASNPASSDQYYVTDAQAAALGITNNPSFQSSVDGHVGLASNLPLTFDLNNRAVPGEYDAIGVLEHEITEVLGRDGALGTWSYNGQPVFAPLDLFRYSAPGVHQLTAGTGYFSVDGQTLLTQFNNPNNGGDAGDWVSSVTGDSFGDAMPDTVDAVTATDQRVLDVLGYTLSTTSGSGSTGSTTTTPSHDFLNAGKSDILIENTGGAVAVGQVGSNGQEAYTAVGALGSEWKFHGAGDFLGAGQDQYLLQNANGAIFAAEVQNGQAHYTQIGAVGSEWGLLSTGDYLADGKSGFLMENTSGVLAIGEAGSNGQAAYTQIGALGAGWKVVGSGDLLGEGHDQFLLQNASGAVAVGDVQSGQAHYTQAGALGSEWSFKGVGDFLGDGKSQFLIENTQGQLAIGEVGSNGQVSYTQVGALGSEWSIKGTGDFLGESHDQFVMQNTSGAVVVAGIQNGQAHYTQAGALGSEWTFHM